MATPVPRTLLCLIVVLQILSACDGSDKTRNIIPIHTECEDQLRTYISEKNEQFKLEKLNATLQLGKFNYGDVKHPFISGYVELKGGVSEERSKLLINAISLMCFPTNKISLTEQADLVLSLKLLSENLFQLRKRGADEFFIRYENDNSFQIYFQSSD